MKITLTYNPPPIPDWEKLAWEAVDDDSHGERTGRGPTPADALRDLADAMEATE